MRGWDGQQSVGRSLCGLQSHEVIVDELEDEVLRNQRVVHIGVGAVVLPLRQRRGYREKHLAVDADQSEVDQRTDQGKLICQQNAAVRVNLARITLQKLFWSHLVCARRVGGYARCPLRVFRVDVPDHLATECAADRKRYIQQDDQAARSHLRVVCAHASMNQYLPAGLAADL